MCVKRKVNWKGQQRFGKWMWKNFVDLVYLFFTNSFIKELVFFKISKTVWHRYWEKGRQLLVCNMVFELISNQLYKKKKKALRLSLYLGKTLFLLLYVEIGIKAKIIIKFQVRNLKKNIPVTTIIWYSLGDSSLFVWLIDYSDIKVKSILVHN